MSDPLGAERSTDVSERQPATADREALADEVARLRAGEADDPGPPETQPTPRQWLRRLNDADADTRLRIAADCIAMFEAQRRCFEENHAGAVRERQRVFEALSSVSPEALARVRAAVGFEHQPELEDVSALLHAIDVLAGAEK